MNNKKPLILIIDDDQNFIEIFSAKLTQAGCAIEYAIGGEQGIKLARELQPALILMDVEMPSVNGVQALSIMKDDPSLKNIKIAFLTSYGEKERTEEWQDEKVAREVGAIDYIRKTDDLNSVVEEVKGILAR